MRPGAWAWIGLVSGIVIYDAACPHGHTMSEEVDRWLAAHPFVTIAVWSLVTAHILNLYPDPRYDVMHVVFTKLGRKPAAH